MRTIYLVRHGIPAFPDGKIVIQGKHVDLPLDDYYAEDAYNLKDFFKDKRIDNWYSSPLLRAKQTLEHFMPSEAEIKILEDAAELDFGSWEGKSWDECRALYPELFEKKKTDNSVMPQDGEQLADGARRMLSALKKTEGNCVIATHWVIGTSVCCLLTNFPYSRYLELSHPYLGVTEIEENNGVFTVKKLGQKVCSCPRCEKFVYR